MKLTNLCHFVRHNSIEKAFLEGIVGEERKRNTKKKMGAGYQWLVGGQHRRSRKKNNRQGSVSWDYPGSNVSYRHSELRKHYPQSTVVVRKLALLDGVWCTKTRILNI